MVTKTVKKKAPRKKAVNAAKKEKPEDIKLQILQTTKCKTVSGKATLI